MYICNLVCILQYVVYEFPCVFHIFFCQVHSLSAEELSQIHELLLSGYWAFECLTVRDYNDMICGICGIAPKLEIAERHTSNVLELKNVEVKHLYNWWETKNV